MQENQKLSSIVVKLDVSKVDKTKLFKGKSGTYLDVVLIATPDSKYDNDFVAIQGVSKEEREQGVKGSILGNAKILERRGTTRPAVKPAEADAGDAGFEPPF